MAMKPRRKGYQAFILKSAGMAEYLETNGQKKALVDKNGIVRVRPTKVSRSKEGKCVTYNNGLAAFVLNGRWHTAYSRIVAITKLINKLVGAECQFNPPEKKKEEVIKELNTLKALTPDEIYQKAQNYISELKKARKLAYAKRLEQEITLDKVKKAVEDFHKALSFIGL